MLGGNRNMKIKKYIGVVLGAAYGLAYRLLCEKDFGYELYDFSIYSISFIWILPITIGLIPILVGQSEILKSRSSQLFFPFLSVLLFFVMSVASGIEDWLCILILTLPYTIVAGISGVLFAELIKSRSSNKLYSIVILPFLFLPIESALNNKVENYEVLSKIEIDAQRLMIWDNILEVDEISENEYESGLFNYIGVPRPIKSEIKNINGEQIRIGYFTDELKLYEKIVEKDYLKYVDFKIDLNKSTFRDLPTDRHILQSKYFKFDKIGYELAELENGKVSLKLSCSYTIESKMNWYANFWAKLIIKDFEERLLKSLKQKIENTCVE